MVQCSNKTWIVDPTNEFRITEGPSLNKGIRGKLGSGGERSEPTDQSTANSNSASKADNFSFFKYVARRSGSDFRISALFSLVLLSLSTDLVLVSLH